MDDIRQFRMDLEFTFIKTEHKMLYLNHMKHVHTFYIYRNEIL